MTKKKEKTEGFFRIDHSLVKDEKVISRIGANAWAVYTVLLSYVNGESGLSFPSYRRIMELTGLGKSTVSNALKKLEEHGLIKKESKGIKHGSNNEYTVNPHPTKIVTGDGKRKMTRTKKATTKTEEVREDKQDTPTVAPTVAESEPVKVIQPETPITPTDLNESVSKSAGEMDTILSEIFNLAIQLNDRASYPLVLGIEYFINSRRLNIRNYGATVEKAVEKFKIERNGLQARLDKRAISISSVSIVNGTL